MHISVLRTCIYIEREKGRGVATHAPLPWDTTPGKDVVTSARTPERIERERQRERER